MPVQIYRPRTTHSPPLRRAVGLLPDPCGMLCSCPFRSEDSLVFSPVENASGLGKGICFKPRQANQGENSPGAFPPPQTLSFLPAFVGIHRPRGWHVRGIPFKRKAQRRITQLLRPKRTFTVLSFFAYSFSGGLYTDTSGDHQLQEVPAKETSPRVPESKHAL